MAVNPAIATVAAGQVIAPTWGTDVADTLNKAPRLVSGGAPVSGSTSVQIPVPVNTYERFRFTMVGRPTTGTGELTLRFQNPVTVAAEYRGQTITERGDGTRAFATQNGSGNMPLGIWDAWNSQILEIDIYGGKGTQVVSWHSRLYRIGNAAAEFAETRTHGRYNTAIALNAINIAWGLGPTFHSSCKWRLEGFQ